MRACDRRRRWGWWAAAGSCPGAASPCPRGSTRCSCAQQAPGRPQAAGGQGTCLVVHLTWDHVHQASVHGLVNIVAAGAPNGKSHPLHFDMQMQWLDLSSARHVLADSNCLPARRLRCMASDVPLTVLLSRSGRVRGTCCARSWAHAWRGRRGWRATWSVLHAPATRLRCTCSGSGQDPVHTRVPLQAESMRHRGRLLVPAALLAEATGTPCHNYLAAEPEGRQRAGHPTPLNPSFALLVART